MQWNFARNYSYPLVLMGLVVFILAGCGYSLLKAPGSAGSENGVSSIAVPIFANRSGEPELEQRLTVAVRRAFIDDGRLRMTHASAADAVVEGSISAYQLQPLAFDVFDNVTQYRLRLTLQATLRHRSSQRVIQSQQFMAVQEYSLPRKISGRETARQRALDVASRQLAQQLVKVFIEVF